MRRVNDEFTNKRKMQVLEVIDDYLLNNGYSPSMREIAETMKFHSASTAHKYVKLLVDDGYLETTDHSFRSIRRVNSPVETPLITDNAVKVPILGVVTAGMPITAIENIMGYVSFVTNKSHSGNLFALKIRGESMINAGIYDDDLVIVQQTSCAENGDIVVALIDREEATVKTFYKENGHFRLQPENDYMEPIIVDEVSILGKVIGLQREF
jgi:repressor LexA